MNVIVVLTYSVLFLDWQQENQPFQGVSAHSARLTRSRNEIDCELTWFCADPETISRPDRKYMVETRAIGEGRNRSYTCGRCWAETLIDRRNLVLVNYRASWYRGVGLIDLFRCMSSY